jgi:fumarate reductase flavoprotein subunit
MAALLRAATAVRADLLTEARLSDLRREGEGWRLVLARPGGAEERLHARAVLLACNGFGGNAEMVARLLPAMAGAPFAGHVGNDGTAIRLGHALGAALADLGGFQGHGSWVIPQGTLMTWAVMMEGGVQLNAQGRRFHDETAGYSEASLAVLAQPGGIAWNVFSAPQLALARQFPDFRAAEAAGALREAADLAALARVIGCPSVDLGGAALAPPFYAVKVTGALFHTQGGLDIDDRCRVRRADASVIDGLWAAGGAARGVSGDAVWGYLSGNGLLSAVAGGFVAARSIAEALA